jgi:hypothetical protein
MVTIKMLYLSLSINEYKPAALLSDTTTSDESPPATMAMFFFDEVINDLKI